VRSLSLTLSLSPTDTIWGFKCFPRLAARTCRSGPAEYRADEAVRRAKACLRRAPPGFHGLCVEGAARQRTASPAACFRCVFYTMPVRTRAKATPARAAPAAPSLLSGLAGQTIIISKYEADAHLPPPARGAEAESQHRILLVICAPRSSVHSRHAVNMHTRARASISRGSHTQISHAP